MNQFTLKIATNAEQSDRITALGIKPETADCFIRKITKTGGWSDYNTSHSLFESWMNKENIIKSMFKPAWSLSRLLEMMPIKIVKDRKVGSLFISHEDISYFGFGEGGNLVFLFGYSVCDNENVFDIAIDMIEYLIKFEYFDKEYLK